MTRLLIAVAALYWVISALAIVSYKPPEYPVDPYSYWQDGYWITSHPAFIAVTGEPGAISIVTIIPGEWTVKP